MNETMAGVGAGLTATVAAARRRLIARIALREFLLAASIALLGAALLLLLGTDRFPAAWLWAFVGGGAAAGLFRARSFPDAYAAARLLDERLRSEDQISTAVYFAESNGSPVFERQRALAERVARTADARRVSAGAPPRTAYPALGMFALVGALLMLRLGAGPGLDLRPPLPPMLFPALAEAPDLAETPSEESVRAAPTDSAESEELVAREARPRPPRAPETVAALTAGEGAEPSDDEAFQMPEVEGLSIDGESTGDELTAESRPASSGSEAESDSGRATDPSEQRSEDWSETSNNLLDRLREAFQNLLREMGREEPQSASSSEAQAAEAQSEGGRPSDEAGARQSAESGAEGGEPSEAEMEGGESADAAAQQAAQGRGSDSPGDQPGGDSEAAASSGSADGSKESAREQERQAALDALEEFYMQRAEDVRGEVMVETSAAEQIARAPDRPTQAARRDLGSAVGRDEIPLAYQRYIQNYFRNLREKE